MYCDDINVETSQMKVQENGNCPVDNNSTLDYSHMQNKKKKSPLRLGKKIYEFYNAPITKFWFYTVSVQNPVLLVNDFVKQLLCLLQLQCDVLLFTNFY